MIKGDLKALWTQSESLQSFLDTYLSDVTIDYQF